MTQRIELCHNELRRQQAIPVMLRELPPLPVDTSNFRALRNAGEIYVDKTELAARLVESFGGFLFIRPRGFGKSLLLSTFETLFRDGNEPFRGLAVEKAWRGQTYRVVRLDFSEISEFRDAAEFRARFHERIAILFGEHGFLPTGRYDLPIEFSRWLSSLEVLSLVLLIDEYDAPLLRCLDRPEVFQAVCSLMIEFFLILKARGGCLRFVFVTGTTKLSHACFGMAFNNMQDISFDPCYGALAGFTEEEVEANFGPYLERAGTALKMTHDDLMALLEVHYGGYAFDQRVSSRVFCPFSVLRFLNRPDRGFLPYWFESADDPSCLLRRLQPRALKALSTRDGFVWYRLRELRAPWEGWEMDGEALLTQVGWLTLRSVDGEFAELGYPNEDAAQSMMKLLGKGGA